MASAKLLLLTAIVAVMSASASAGILGAFFPDIMAPYWKQEATAKEAYHFVHEEPEGEIKREEMGMILNPGTENEELVVMGTYSNYDEKSGIETTTVYKADKDGYKPMYMIKNRKLSPGALKSAAG